MPVTRSSSRHNSQQPLNHPYSTRLAGSSGSGDIKKASKSPSNEIIVLSSDDDEPSLKGTLFKKSFSRTSRKKGASSAAPPVLSVEVLELSSDDESHSKKSSTRKQAHSPETTNKELQRTIKKLQEELKRSEKRLASAAREVEELKHKCSESVPSGLGDHTSCEVCTLTMWCPYTLPQCGHSFCESCLVDWFSTTQAQHMTANPQLNDNRAALAGQIQMLVQMVPNLHAYGTQGPIHLRAVLAELRRHRPEYTCPSCRKEVLNQPVEDFRLKDLITKIAGMMGEKNMWKETSSHRGSGPFDHFFAAPVLAA